MGRSDTGNPRGLTEGIDVVASVAFVALIAGLIEVATQAVRLFVLHQFTWSSRHVGWMAPASYLAFLGAVAAPFVLVALVRPRWPVLPVITGIVAVLGAFAAGRMVSAQRLHVAALGLIAVGVGVQLGRFARLHPERWRSIARKGSLGLAALVLLWGAGSAAWWRWSESKAVGALKAAPSGAPNVLLLVLDTVRGENLSLYGYPRPTTPWLQRFAAEGVTFERAFSAAPWTLPSHATMFTGREPWEHRASFFTALDETYPTLAEAFQRQGYLTAGFVANHIYANEQTGLQRGFIRFETFPVSLRQILLSSELGQLLSSQRSRLAIRAADRPQAADINARLLRWLSDSRPAGRPFFAFLNYMDAHLPHRLPPAVMAEFAAGNPMVDKYDAAVADLDRRLESLFAELDRSGVLENTIVVITSDHGEHLGDHKLDDHANSLYTQLLRVPLVIVHRGVIPAGIRIPSQVGLVDLPATITDLAGLASVERFPGRSLAAAFSEGGMTHPGPIGAQVDQHPLRRSWFRNANGPLWSVFEDGHHLIENSNGTLELFDYVADPAEEHDQGSRPELAGRLTRLRAVLDSIRGGADRSGAPQ